MELSELEVFDRFRPILNIEKKEYIPAFRFKNKDEKWKPPVYPDYYHGYALAADYYDQIRPHAEKGFFPESLFAKRAPNETPSETEYIRENFQQITLSVFKDYVDTNGRATHRNNWSIKFDESSQYKNELSLEYYLNHLPEWGSLEYFNFKFLPPNKYQDAEGVVVIMPQYIPTEDVNGEVIISQTELISPVPRFYHCTSVVHKSEDLYILKSDEKSDVLYYDKPEKMGLVFYAFTENVIYRIYQTGKLIDFEFDIEIFWQHDTGIVPVKTVGGLSTQIDNLTIQMSPFMYAVDTLNDVLIDASMLRGIKAMTCYPFRIMVGDPCDFEIKVDGEPLNCSGFGYHVINNNRVTCPSCHGKGMKDRVSPYGTLLIKREGNVESGDGIDPTKAMYYAAPTAEMPKLIREEIEYGLRKTYDTLHMKRMEIGATGGTQKTATEDLSDQKALMASIEANTRQLFSLFKWEIEVIGKQRYGDAFTAPSITEPVRYDLFIESDDLKKISDSVAAGQPAFVIQTLIYNYLQKLYYNDEQSKKIFELISTTDNLMVLSSDEINQRLSRNIIASWQVVLHDSAINLVNNLIAENPDFLLQSLTDQREQLITAAQAQAATVPQGGSAALNAAQQRINAIVGQS
jgi:hypothetical protein